jgi:putative sterol carrier protein
MTSPDAANGQDDIDPAFDPAALAGADAAQLAEVASQASDEQLAEVMNEPALRKKILDEIFNRMADHVDPEAIKDVDAVLHFKITDAPGGGDDIYEAAFKDGAVTVNQPPESDSPKVTITAPPVPFLKLVTGQESGPAMFLSGKLKVSGDLMFASRMTSFFSLPSAA